MIRKSQYAREGGRETVNHMDIQTDGQAENQKFIYLQLFCFIFKSSIQQSSS